MQNKKINLAIGLRGEEIERKINKCQVKCFEENIQFPDRVPRVCVFGCDLLGAEFSTLSGEGSEEKQLCDPDEDRANSGFVLSLSSSSCVCRTYMSKSDSTKKMAMSPSERRLQKELMSLIKEPPPGVTVDEESVSQNLTQWIINIDGVEGTLYEGEHFQLLFKFNNKYPFDSPEVTFIGSNIPVHPHVYSNGHICLSILTDDWSPALSVQSVCLSISSMLSSCREKRRPPDNGIYVKTCNKNPKKTKWWYHDDSV